MNAQPTTVSQSEVNLWIDTAGGASLGIESSNNNSFCEKYKSTVPAKQQNMWVLFSVKYFKFLVTLKHLLSELSISLKEGISLAEPVMWKKRVYNENWCSFAPLISLLHNKRLFCSRNRKLNSYVTAILRELASVSEKGRSPLVC